MKAITISAPHAGFIFDPTNLKWVENRNQSHAWSNYRGPLLIHCGRGTQYLPKSELAAYPVGMILGVVDLVNVLHTSHLQRAHRKGTVPSTGRTVGEILDHLHTSGPYCLILANPRKFRTPIPWGGAQGLWNCPDDVVAEQLAIAEEVRCSAV